MHQIINKKQKKLDIILLKCLYNFNPKEKKICIETKSEYTQYMMGPHAQQSLGGLLSPDLISLGWQESCSLKYAPWRYQELLSIQMIDNLCIDSHIAVSLHHTPSQTQIAALYTYDGQHAINTAGRIVRQPLTGDRPQGLMQLEWTKFSNNRQGLVGKFLSGIPWIPFIVFNILLMLLPQTVSNVFFWVNIVGIMIVLLYFGRAMAKYFVSIIFSSRHQIGLYTITTADSHDLLYLQHPTIQAITNLTLNRPHRIIIDPRGAIRWYRPLNTPQSVRRNLWIPSRDTKDPSIEQWIQSGQSLLSHGVL